MQSGRSDRVFSPAEPPNVFRRSACDVIVEKNGESEWIAISCKKAAVGEILILDIDEGGRPQQVPVCVIESRKVVVDGGTRHRIRLLATDLPPVLYEQQIRRG